MSEKNEYPWLSEELTPWHDGSVKPVHVGVYEVNDEINAGARWFSFFDGFKFCYRSLSANDAFLQKDFETLLGKTPKKWRGLAKEPK